MSSRARLVLRAIERQDVEGIRLDFVVMLARVQDIEIGNTVNPKDDSLKNWPKFQPRDVR